MPTLRLISRPGGQIIAQYYNFLRLGREGYAKIHNACYHTAQYLAREIEKLGPFEMIFSGDSQKANTCISVETEKEAKGKLLLI